MSDELDDDQIMCATYTHARRHPMVLGRIGGWTPPFQLSLTQLGVVVAALLVETQTYRWWGQWIPKLLGLVVIVGFPCGLAWAVRSARVEGRGLPRAAVAYLSMLWLPRDGQVGGRPYKESRPARPFLQPIYLDAGEDEP
jgi:hypothetical protein